MNSFFIVVSVCSLIYLIYWVVKSKEEASKELQEARSLASRLYYERKTLEEKENLLITQEKAFKTVENSKYQDIELFSKIYGDYQKALFDFEADALIRKKNPAFYTADKIKNLAQEKGKVEALCKQLEYKILKYEKLFPWIKDFSTDDMRVIDSSFYLKNDFPPNIPLLKAEFEKYKLNELEIIKNHYSSLKTKEDNIEIRIKELSDEFEKYKLCEVDNIKKKKMELEEYENILHFKVKDFPLISEIIADLKVAKEETLIYQLIHKPNPALKAADVLKKVKSEKKEIIKELYTLKYKLSHYEKLIPWIAELEDEPIISKTEYFNPDYQKDDAAGYWLSPEEYASLSDIEKYQRALDRYMKRNKSPQEIGRDYERFIGYLYEKDGFDVFYQGIFDGLEDLGRDLICKKDDQVLIVQCKCWAQHKTIHEKHINQLFGTTVMYYLTHINKDGSLNEFYELLKEERIIPLFVTSTQYSETALAFAKSLGVRCRTEKLGSYPIIKCNVNKSSKEKIYHLPFDQLYDRVQIKTNDEFYVMNVSDAEKNGFRRAMRWQGNKF